MPYIRNKHIRAVIEDTIDDDILRHIDNPGTLNFTISYIVHAWLKREGVCYDNIVGVMGTLDCVAREFYRTVAAPYEDKKRRENGSVSRLDRVK